MIAGVANARRIRPALIGGAHRAGLGAEVSCRVADDRAQRRRGGRRAVVERDAELSDAELVARVTGMTAGGVERVDRSIWLLRGALARATEQRHGHPDDVDSLSHTSAPNARNIRAGRQRRSTGLSEVLELVTNGPYLDTELPCVS